MTTDAHALVAPSGLALTMNCAASLLLQLLVEAPPESEEEAEGSAAHHHAVLWAKGQHRYEVGQKFEFRGRTWEVDVDMLNGSKLFAYHTVRGNVGRFEDPVAMPSIHEQCWGTPDFWLHRPLSLIDVTDYKYGHRYVEAFENWQCIGYVIGVATRCNVLQQDDLPVVIRIVQPRAYHRDGPVREWHTTLGDIKRYVARIAAQVLVALSENAPATVGAHCTDCRARHVCKTLQYGAMHVVQFVSAGETVNMPVDALGAEGRILYDALQILTARYEGITAQIEAKMRSGTNVPFWIMEPGQSRLAWNPDVTVDAVEQLGQSINVPLVSRKPLTPKQAQDAGILPEVIAALATRGTPGRSLKPDNNQTARKVFGAKQL